MSWKFTIVLAAVLAASPAWFSGLLSAADAKPSAPDAAYQKDYEKWQTELADNLKESWLPLAGLFWLKPGENTFGTDASNAIVFPKGPARAGVFELQGKDVNMKLTPDAHATIDGKPGTAAKMIPDTEDKTTLVEMGSLRFHVIVRGERIGIRLKDVESPAVENFRGLTFYPPDLNYRVTAKWEPSDGKKMVDVPNVLGDVSPTTVSGTAVFKINGQEVRLTDLGEDPTRDYFSFSTIDQQDRHISGWTFYVHRSTGEWDGNLGLQPRPQSALRRHCLRHLPARAQREPAADGDSRGREIRPGSWPSLDQD